jgi:hypothetical protein
MALHGACKHHIQTANASNGDIKLYAECRVQPVEHQLIRAHLDAQSMGSGCQCLKPQYRAIPTSTMLVSGRPFIPLGTVAVQKQHICCYRSVVAEPLDDPTQAVHLSVQRVLARTPFTFDVPHQCMLTIETIQDNTNHADLIRPTFVQKENGAIYLPIHPAQTCPFVIELFQVWRSPTFADLEKISMPGKSKESEDPAPVFGVRVSLVPTVSTDDDLYTCTQRLLKFIDLLVYG